MPTMAKNASRQTPAADVTLRKLAADRRWKHGRRCDDFGMVSDRPFVPVAIALNGGFSFRRTPPPTVAEVRRVGQRPGQSPRNAFRPHHSVSMMSKIR